MLDNLRINNAGHLEIGGCDTVELVKKVYERRCMLWMKWLFATTAECIKKHLINIMTVTAWCYIQARHSPQCAACRIT